MTTTPLRLPVPLVPSVPAPPAPAVCVRPGSLTDHGRRVADAATLDPAVLAAAARRIAAAVPGSRSAAAAEALARRWDSALAAWVADVGAHGDALRATARDYAATDARTATALRGTSS